MSVFLQVLTPKIEYIGHLDAKPVASGKIPIIPHQLFITNPTTIIIARPTTIRITLSAVPSFTFIPILLLI